MAWTFETDIVCVGSGAAGLTAAVCATINGDDVIVVEKMPYPGGTTLMSGGVHWIPNNFALRASGIDDSRKDALAYMARYSAAAYYRPGHPTLGLSQHAYDLLAAFYDNAAPMVDFLLANDVYCTRQWTFHDRISMVTPLAPKLTSCSPDYFDNAVENKVPSGRVLTPIQRDGTYAFGMHLVGYMREFLEAHRRTVLCDHRVTDVIRNEDGAVVGVVAATPTETVTIGARKAVIFGSGGFAHNVALKEAFHVGRTYHAFAAQGMDGDFIPIATKAGAVLGNMTGAWRAEVVVEQALASKPGDFLVPVFTPVGDSMIYVNKYGRRSVNEYRSYSDRPKAALAFDPTAEDYPNQLYFMIFDQRVIDIYGGNIPVPPPGENAPWMISAPTIPQLAERLDERLAALRQQGCGDIRLAESFVANLQASITRFNGFAARGVDEDFGRGNALFDRQIYYQSSSPIDPGRMTGQSFLPNNTMYPLAEAGPYHAIILGGALLDTNGGPAINASAQVIDYRHVPIPGLYGAGNCIASPGREAYFGAGGTLGMAMTFAFIAAKAAHGERPRDLSARSWTSSLFTPPP